MEKTCFTKKMRSNLKQKCKITKFHNKIIDNAKPFLDQLPRQYMCLINIYQPLVMLKMIR